MSVSAWLRTHRRALASVCVVAVGAVTVTTLAVVYRGNPTTELDLNDGSVWVTKQSALMVGHFNDQSRVLDGGLRTATDEYDILQSGDTVLMHDESGRTISKIDPANVSLTGSAKLPAGALVVLGGRTVAVLDPAKGSLWVVPAAGVGAFEPAHAKPLAVLGVGAAVAVGTDGTVFAVSPEAGSLVTVPVDAQGAALSVQKRQLDGLGKRAQVSITAVGDVPVVWDAASGMVLSSSGLRARVPGAGAGAGAVVLQQPSGPDAAVLVATGSGLVRVPLDGSAVSVVGAGGVGTPAAPVRLDGCSYGAWSGSGRFVRDCAGSSDDLSQAVPGVVSSARLVFRQNRDVVVLNDVIGGSTWVAGDALERVDDWEALTPPKGETEDNEEQVTQETVQSTLPKRSAKNTPPIANPDEFGVRPGRTTVLPVLENDTDADGDVLTVSVPGAGPRLGRLQTINDGSGLQLVVPEDAAGSGSFSYRVDDGRKGTASAKVSLRVHAWSVNEAPVQRRATSLSMEAGGVLTYNVLPDWRDPDGDSLFLKGAEPAPGDEVQVSDDGRVTYRALSGTLGRKDVKVYVSDGRKVAEGTLRLDVRPRGSVDPIATADHVVGRVGGTVTVSPLTNDYSAGSQELRLTRVQDVPGAKIVPDFQNKTFTFRADTVGTYYVPYLIAAGSATADGIVRVDIEPDVDTDLPPVAVQDVATLPVGGDTLVNVLANDSDPSGGILVVQSVDVPDDAGVSVAVQGHETLRVTDQGSLADQITIGYTISNGTRSATGQVVVIPVPAVSTIRPPSAQDDTAIVRAGDVVTIPVLDNDSDPNGTKLHVAPDLVPPLVDAKDGQAFVSQNTVRFQASDKPGTAYVTYEAVDASGQKDAGYVTIQVTAPDPKTNRAPLPRDLTGRVLSGSKTRIQVPLDGIDPDGDSVQLVGLASAPQKGRVDVGADYLDYQAIGDATGTDTFTYRVRDRFGAEATATVRVGIAPASTTNQSPYAVKDSVVMRPGRQVAVPVLTNDSDPDGDPFGLVANGLTVPDVAGLAAEVQGDRVVVTAPDTPTETSLQYTIRDQRGASATGVLQISVADDVPLMTPIARDDVVRAEDIKDGAATVDVLANDEDPDGTTGALTVKVDGDAATVEQAGRLRIPITDHDQLIMYTITDQDSLAASAFVHVPSLTSLPPALISTKGVTVKSGQTIELPLRDYVRVAHGQGAVITEHEKVSALHGNGDDLVKDGSTLVYTSADRYFGPDAITFEVTDGTGPDDPTGNKATLVLPITVTPPDNQPPTFTNGQLQVAPGEDAASLDLRALTADPDPGDLDGVTYRVSGGAAGMSAQVDGQTLKVTADASTPKGTVGHFTIELTDGHTAPVTGTVDARVTASTRELAVATDDVIDQADQGKTVRVDVLDNDVNPFAADGKPLKIVAATTEAGDAAVEIAGDHLQITPASSFVGRAVVRYRVQDATGDPDREVEGHVLMTVQGVPAAPGTPTVSSVQDRTVVLSWSPPIDNGAPITKYTVTAVGGGYTKVCEATTCTLDGLTNNVVYSFRVVATNRVGDSPASPASAEARPDARPDTPQPPTLDYGDRSLKVAWTTPPTPGSPVQSYNLEISPAPPSGIASKSKVTGNALTWDGLENGVAYQVRVQAVNLAPEPSSWSGWSASEIPARAPGAPGTPTTSMLQPVGSQAQMKVSWAAAAANGDAVSEYELSVMRGSSTLRTISVAGGTTSQAVVVDASTTDYTYKVRARNKAGWGTYSSVSAPRRGVVAPGAPGTPTGTPGDKKIAVTYTAAAGNGALSSEIRYQYSLNGGAWQGSWSGTSNTITGLTNGTTYKIRVRAVSTVDGATYTGPASASSTGYVPFGVPGTPGATAKASGTNITFTWSAPSSNGAAIDQTQVRYDGGTWQTVAKSGSATKSYGYSTTHKIEVRAHNKAGWGSIGSASATTAAAPKPKATAKTVPGSSVNNANCSTSTCAYVAVKTADFPAGNYTITIRTSLGDNRTYSGFHLPANGTANTPFYFGYPGETVQVQIVGWGYADAVSWY